MMSYITPRFIALALFMTMLFGAYNGLPCANKLETEEGRQVVEEVPSIAPPSRNAPSFTPLREAKPIQLDRRMMGGMGGMGGGGGGPKKFGGGS